MIVIMGRWEPDARGRLLSAAIELFEEQGYDATTAAQIAARAGLTKTTLFRHFADKREILFQGQEMLLTVASEGVERSDDSSTPFAALAAGIRELCAVHTTQGRDLGRRLDVILSSSPELQERAIFKRFAITNALQSALTPRTSNGLEAGILADAGMRAYYDGFAAWIAVDDDLPLSDFAMRELGRYEQILAPIVT